MSRAARKMTPKDERTILAVLVMLFLGLALFMFFDALATMKSDTLSGNLTHVSGRLLSVDGHIQRRGYSRGRSLSLRYVVDLKIADVPQTIRVDPGIFSDFPIAARAHEGTRADLLVGDCTEKVCRGAELLVDGEMVYPLAEDQYIQHRAIIARLVLAVMFTAFFAGFGSHWARKYRPAESGA